jgi:DNA repair exonuclease SbcCD nuclease subunit
MFKYIHCADIHLDSPLRGLEMYEGAPVEAIRGATRRTFEKIIQLAISEHVDFMLIAGDLYDGELQDYRTALFLTQQMAILNRANIPVFIVLGNHDAETRVTKRLSLPPNVYVFPANKPKTKELPELGVAIHGQSFARAAVTDDLAAEYPARREGLFNIGLLHTCLSGTKGHANYAPTSADVLRTRGYDYWALGHVHERMIISESPWIVYPGNPQGRHVRETGDKGCELVRVDGSQIQVEQNRFAHVLWEVLKVDATGAQTADEVYERLATQLQAIVARESRLVCLRIELFGSTVAHLALADELDLKVKIQNILLQVGGDLWLERVVLRTSDQTTASAAQGVESLAEILATIDGIVASDAERASLIEIFSDLDSRIPVELRGEDGINLGDPVYVAGFLEEAAEELSLRVIKAGAQQ